MQKHARNREDDVHAHAYARASALVTLFAVMETHPEMFAPYERLIEIEILGRKRRVPENNSVLRCLQFLQMDAISNADLCWNGDCLNCQVWIDNKGKEKAAIACRTNVKDGMKIVKISKDIPFQT